MVVMGLKISKAEVHNPLRYIMYIFEHLLDDIFLSHKFLYHSYSYKPVSVLKFINMVNYTVRQGDTFSAIASSHGTTVQEIEAANPGTNPNKLQIGQVIHLPGASHAPMPSPKTSGNVPGTQGGSNGGGGFQEYSGPASNFPHPSQWAQYSILWNSNSKLMKLHDSDDEINHIKNAIETVARESGIDVRAILSIIMQECGGNVRVPTTNNGVINPGIMQSHNGVAFNPRDSAGSILQMVRDGTEGTATGPGLKQLYAKYGNYYEVFRAYNSGSVDKGDLNNPMGATGGYVKGVANRLMGHQWSGM